ncbi:MAG TPA: pyridoxamine 5'-phosphate oxidase family protein [Oxalicibacterium sp.]|nr:pyridoxamine 5'-phosphate oxidase family protein [Oxalicibacterium sp.]
MNAPAIKHAPFHEGELRAQQLAGFGTVHAAIRERMPEQHRSFFPLLQYALLATVDEKGQPHASVVTGPPGFISSPSEDALQIARTARWIDQTGESLLPGQPIGMLGIDLATRRRNRANGIVSRVDDAGWHLQVRQSFGNCPKYIQLRELVDVPVADTVFIVAPQQLTRLDERARSMISEADTFFVASNVATAEGGPDVSHKGGRPGFIRIDGDTLTIPDFTGNRYLNTLGNLLLDPRASLLFIDFANGDVLQLRGVTEILWHAEETAQLQGAERLWRFRVETASRIAGALPLRWRLVEMAPTTDRTGTWSGQAI